MLKIVFVGAGPFAAYVHGPALAHYAGGHPGEIELAAVCVRRNADRAREFCREFGFQRVYTDLDEMIDKEAPDACWVVTPIEATRKVAGHIMERNVPVLFEKPPGANLREARELASISRQTGTPNMVAFNRRWAPCTRRALSWAEEHGPIEYIYARMLRPNRMDEQFAYGTGIHLLDCVRSLAEHTVGPVREAKTTRRRWDAGTGGTKGTRNGGAGHGSCTRTDDDSARGARSVALNFHVDLMFASGAGGRCDILPACGMLEESYALFAADKSIAVSLAWSAGEVERDGKAELWAKGEVVEAEAYPFDPPFLSSGFYGEAAEFISALKEGRRPSPSAEEAADSVALAEAVQEGRGIEF